jgi:tetratricopeptide (TPR) repeat protein
VVATLAGVPLPADRLVARGAELAVLERWFCDAVTASEPRLGVVAGESGVGKTRLVADFVRGLDSAEALVVWGASRGNAFLAYEPWVAALRGVVTGGSDRDRELVATVPWLDAAGRPSQSGMPTEETVAEAATELIQRAAGGRTVVIVLDDIQWADRASIELLRRLLEAPIGPSVLVVALERRPVAAAGAWYDARVGGTLRVAGELDLTRLDHDGCAELLRSLDERFDEPELTTVVTAASGGNVFAVRELASFVATELTRLRARELDEVPGLVASLPRTAAALWVARLEPLSREARGTLAAAAVLGLEFDAGVLQWMATDLPAPIVSTLDDAVAAGLVEHVDDSRYRFSHSLIRDHLYDGLSQVRRRRLHRAVARTLQQQDPAGTPPATLAFHFLAAGDAFRRDALRYTIAAARASFTDGAFDTAKALAEQALELRAMLDEDDSAPFAIELGDVLGVLGMDESRTVLLHAADRFDANDDLQALARSADLLLRWAGARTTFHSEAEQELVAPIVALVERILPRLDQVDDGLAARVLARFVFVLDFEGRVEQQRELTRRALRAARAADDRDTLALALFCARPGYEGVGVDEYLAASEELVALGREVNSLEYVCTGLLGMYVWLLDRGDADAADRALEEANELAAQIAPGRVGVLRGGDVKRNVESAVAVRRVIQAQVAGRLDDAERWLGEVMNWAAQPDVQHGRLTEIVAQQFGQLLSERGRVDELADAVAARLAANPGSGILLVNAAWAFTEAGRLDEAARSYAPIADDGFRGIPRDHAFVATHIVLARVAYVLGDATGADLVAARLRPFSGRSSCNGVNCAGPVDQALALCAATASRHEEAIAYFESARDLARRMHSLSFETRAEMMWAETLARAGAPPADVRAHAERAHVLAGTVGMARIEHRAADLLARL